MVLKFNENVIKCCINVFKINEILMQCTHINVNVLKCDENVMKCNVNVFKINEILMKCTHMPYKCIET